jgi:hypothetical protein
MKNLQELVRSLGINEALQLKLISEVGDESDPDMIVAIIKKVLDDEADKLDQEEKKLSQEEVRINQQRLKEEEEAEEEFMVTMDKLEDQANQIRIDTNRQLDQVKMEEVKSDLHRS